MANSEALYMIEDARNECLDNQGGYPEEMEETGDETGTFLDRMKAVFQQPSCKFPKTNSLILIVGSIFAMTLTLAVTFGVLYYKNKDAACQSPAAQKFSEVSSETNREWIADFLKYNTKMKDKYCGKERCHNRGECAIIDFYPDVKSNETHVDYRYECKCVRGTAGDQCELSVCDVKQICNGFPCVAGVSEDEEIYVCDCPKGYSGKRCEEHPCNNQPCLNGGTCNIKSLPNNAGFTHTCHCPAAYTGLTCADYRCDDFKCVHGKCVVNGSIPSCLCADGYEGDDCSVESCDCLHGKCIRDDDGKPSCSCFDGFTGEKCGYRLPANMKCHIDGAKRINCPINVAENIISSKYTLLFGVFPAALRLF